MSAPSAPESEAPSEVRSAVRRAWAWVSARGTDGLPDGKAKRVRVLNQSAALLGTIIAPYVLLFAGIGATFLAACVIPLALAFWSVIGLNHHRRYDLARILMMSSGNLSIFTYSASLGLDTNIHAVFVVTAVEPLLFSEPHERRFILVWTLIPLGLQLTRLLGYELFVPHTSVSESAIEVVGMIMLPTSMIMTLVIVAVFYRANTRLEGRLAQLVERLKERGEVLRATNEQLSAEVVAREVAQRKTIKLQSQLLDTARKAGMAEIAADVLHNVGNASNSVGVNVNLLHETLARPMLPELERLSTWISSPQFPLREQLQHHERTAKLPSFIKALTGKLEQRQEELLGYVSLAAKGAAQVEQILVDQQQLASAERIIEPIDVAELFESALAISGHETSQIQVVRHRGEPSRFVSDRARVLQIMTHLASNAIESLEADVEGEPTLTMSAQTTEAGALCLRIADTGVGIDPRDFETIFRSGFTTKTTGSGYGLHNSANLARELGGSLSVHSEGAGRGATFTLEIPFRAAGPDATAQIVRR